jgi:O-antigen ligase
VAAVLIGLSLFGYALGLLFTEARLAVPLRRLLPPLLMISAPVTWAFVQMTPLGQSDLAHPIWPATGEALTRSIPGRISVDPWATGSAVVRLFLYIGIFFLAVQLCRSVERAFLALNVVVAFAASYALYGLAAYALMPDHLLWPGYASHRGDPSSTLVGNSSYATFAALGLIASIALLAKLVYRPAVSSASRGVLFARLPRIAGAKASGPVAAILALAAAILLTHTQDGLLATGIGVIVLLLCLIIVTRLNRFSRVALVALVIGGIGLTVRLVDEAILDSGAATGAPADQQAALHALVSEGIADSPLLGHGYGAFESAFQGYRDSTLEGYLRNANNSYLELAFDLGLPATSLLVIAIASVGLRCLVGVYIRRRDIVYPALGVAVAAFAGAQALVDVSMQTPAVAALLAFILGLGYSQSWASSDV